MRKRTTSYLFLFILLILPSLCLIFQAENLASAATLPRSLAASLQKLPLKSTPEDADLRYRAAKDYYYLLMRDKTLGDQRRNWLKGARNFRRVYLDFPKHDLAPSCLFMMGKMYRSMFNHFHNPSDSNDAIYYFNDVANIYSHHRLADDSLSIIADIYVIDMQNPDKAITVLSSLISRYPSGDQYAKAVNRLQQISTNNKIPIATNPKRSALFQHLVNVLPVKYWSSDEYTRVAIKTSKPVKYKVTLLDKIGNKPRRLYIDFTNSYIPPKFRSLVPIEDGLLKQVRTGQFNPSTVRVVMDIESLSDYKVFNMEDPFRIIVDVKGEKKNKSKPAPLAPQAISKSTKRELKKKEPLQVDKKERESLKVIVPKVAIEKNTKIERPKSEQPIISLKDHKKKRLVPRRHKRKKSKSTNDPSFSLAQQLGLGVRSIVIDPGHGGKDPGAMAFGLKEKDIVLKVAKKVAVILKEKYGFTVHLTRSDDRFIQLEERTAIANTQNADLFLSIHINANPQPKVHGIETYFLNLATNDEAMRVAARENATTSHSISDMQDILSDLMQNSKIEESSRLAEFVQASMISGLKNKNYRVKNLGVKQAPFYVLIGAEMPAVLAEISFITNPEEADRLENDNYLTCIAGQIAAGVVDYVNNSTTAALQL